MDFQALSDVFKFEVQQEQLRFFIHMRRQYDPADAAPGAGPALQRQNAMSYCEFREMKQMVDAVLRKPRTAEMLRAWAPSACVGTARGVRQFLADNVAWRWWWGETLSEKQSEVVAIMLFRELGVAHEFVRRLIMCEKWMIAYFRMESGYRPLDGLLYDQTAAIMRPEFLEDGRIADDMEDHEDYHTLACRIRCTLPLIKCHAAAWNHSPLTMRQLAYCLHEDDEQVERVADYMGLVLA
jgi:hypothetical protein